LGARDNDEALENRTYRQINSWDGTTVVMQIPAGRPGDFSSLLSLCGELADRARKSSGKAGLDFLNAVPEIEGLTVVSVGEFAEDVERAANIREATIIPLSRSAKVF
jgi:hypothetical protein